MKEIRGATGGRWRKTIEWTFDRRKGIGKEEVDEGFCESA
jgi:hypothetical protein